MKILKLSIIILVALAVPFLLFSVFNDDSTTENKEPQYNQVEGKVENPSGTEEPEDQEFKNTAKVFDEGYVVDYTSSGELIKFETTFEDIRAYTVISDYTYSSGVYHLNGDVSEIGFSNSHWNLDFNNNTECVYSFKFDMICGGAIPGNFSMYLKQPGYTDNVFLINFTNSYLETITAMGMNFEDGGNVVLSFELSFDFDEQIVYLNLYDVDGHGMLIATDSIARYQTEELISKDITLRIHIDSNTVLNEKHDTISFANWSIESKHKEQ